MPKVAFVERVFNRVHGFRGKKSCFSGKLQREKLLLCTSRTSAARSCKVNGHLREGRGLGACRRTTSADSLQANTLVRLFATQGQTLFAPRFRSTQPWSYAHNPAMPGPYNSQLGSSSASTRQPFSVGTRRTVVTVAVSGTIVSSPAQPAKSSLSQVSTT